MTDDQQPQFTISELGAKFGSKMAETFSELITAEKIIESQRRQIQKMSKNEAGLLDHIEALEAQLAERDREIRERVSKEDLSEAAAEIAAAGDAVIIKGKAAPVEAA